MKNQNSLDPLDVNLEAGRIEIMKVSRRGWFGPCQVEIGFSAVYDGGFEQKHLPIKLKEGDSGTFTVQSRSMAASVAAKRKKR